MIGIRGTVGGKKCCKWERKFRPEWRRLTKLATYFSALDPMKGARHGKQESRNKTDCE